MQVDFQALHGQTWPTDLKFAKSSNDRVSFIMYATSHAHQLEVSSSSKQPRPMYCISVAAFHAEEMPAGYLSLVRPIDKRVWTLPPYHRALKLSWRDFDTAGQLSLKSGLRMLGN